MVFELHIWGPAFGLPSIDPECLATIVYCRHALPDGSWSLLASSDTKQNPFQQLPALRHGTTWVAGYERIVQYLQENSEAGNLDANLSDIEQADCDAYASFIRSRGQPLLDLSLYVSSDNYTTCTRGALADLLSWPESWTIPHRLRQEARNRSDHLGLSGLDVDFARQEEEQKQKTGIAAQIPVSLRKPKYTVSSLLGRTSQQSRFRLDAVTADFLDPLQEKLGERDWLIGSSSISSTDCLAIAYLTLMQNPEMPQAWLKDALTARYSRLGAWAKRHASTTLGPPVTSEAAVLGQSSGSALPWKASPVRRWLDTGVAVIETLISSLPIVRLGYETCEVKDLATPEVVTYQQKQVAYTKIRNKQVVYSQVMAACLSTASVVTWLVYTGVLGLSFRRGQAARSRNFGEAGALLGLG